MWKHCSHILAPLTDLVGKGKKKIEKTEVCQTAFQDIKKLMAKESILKYVKFGVPSGIHMDASDIQPGSVIVQDRKPLAFYSRKLSCAQRNCTTSEQELLSRHLWYY